MLKIILLSHAFRLVIVVVTKWDWTKLLLSQSHFFVTIDLSSDGQITHLSVNLPIS